MSTGIGRRLGAETSENEELGVAVVGASKFAAFCLDSWAPLAQLRPVGVWSRTPQSAQAFAQQTGILDFEELGVLLARPDVDVAYVASIPTKHAEQSLMALAAGKHVLSEKPLATSLRSAQDLLTASEAADLRLGVNFMMRHGPLWQSVSSIIESTVLGQVVHGSVMNLAGDDGLPSDHWFWDPSKSGGIFVEHAVHHFDLLRSWLGEGSVIAAHATARPNGELIDQVGCVVRHDRGATVSHYHGFHQSRFLDRQEVRLIFELGEIRLSGWVADHLTLTAIVDEPGLAALTAMLPKGASATSTALTGDLVASRRSGRRPVSLRVDVEWQATEQPQEVYAGAVRDLMADFLRSCRDRSHQPRVSAQDGAAALALALVATQLSDQSWH